MGECGWCREYSKAIEYQIEITKLNSYKEYYNMKMKQ
jgi:hypothetical protein